MAPTGATTAASQNDTRDMCNEGSYMTPWATVIAMFAVYVIALLWFCRHGKKVCLPPPDFIYPYKKRLRELKAALGHLLVDDIFVELSDQKLGEGAVGFVFRGFVFPRTQTRFKQKTCAAVKMSYPMPVKSIGLLEEAARMAKLDHPNIVKLIAVSKLSFSAFRPMFAMEWLAGGSLAEYFRDEIRSKEEHQRPVVKVAHVLSILIQVGKALRYMHESRDNNGNEFTHRDVAARNVLLTERNLATATAKLGDFGLPIDFGPRLPIPWLPPEVVNSLDRTCPKHVPESDVWMFGVLSWECATLGADPHYQRTIEDICDCFKWPDRGLARPSNCPDDYWCFVMDCLSEQHRRPKFSGPEDSGSCALKRMRDMFNRTKGTDQSFSVAENISNCTCSQHRCHRPLPRFAAR
uniref:Protein kinase domain-containing protein n=2 Tax=Plectus sambesii TaxID=2011161 RepID=A0A914VDX9_9BILA